jgi:hypothetical protein
MVKFPFFAYFFFPRFIINAISEKAREELRDFIIRTFEKKTLPTLSMKGQEKAKIYLIILKQMPTRNFFVFIRLTKYNDFQIFLYMLDVVRDELEEDLKTNYKKKVGVQ